MSASLGERLISLLAPVSQLYYRLLLVVGPAGTGKTEALRLIEKHRGFPRINLNLVLSRRLLELTERQRILQLPTILAELLAPYRGGVILLDNLEILFDVALKQDPLRLLQKLARQQTVLAAWPGTVAAGKLVYAEPGHPEYRRYPLQDFLVVTTEPNTDDVSL